MKYLYGPVPSRRLGYSLGVDLIPHKVCTFDCIYCQLGRTTIKTSRRREYAPAKKVLGELRGFFDSGGECGVVTLAGSGEPTLNTKIGDIIREVKDMTDTPLAVLTNSSLLTREEVRNDLLNADVVVPSLDAASPDTFKKINRQAEGITVSDVIDGLKEFRKEYAGEVRLEVMAVAGLNDTKKEVDELRQAIGIIRPDSIDLNTVVRPPAESYAKPL